MDETLLFFIIVLSLFMAREVLSTITIHKLTNKLMSRNYYDYTFTNHLPKENQPKQQTLHEGLKEEEGFKEDLAPIETFMT